MWALPRRVTGGRKAAHRLWDPVYARLNRVDSRVAERLPDYFVDRHALQLVLPALRKRLPPTWDVPLSGSLRERESLLAQALVPCIRLDGWKPDPATPTA